VACGAVALWLASTTPSWGAWATQARRAPKATLPYVQLLHAATSASRQLLHEGRLEEAWQVVDGAAAVAGEPGLPRTAVALFRVHVARVQFFRDWLAGADMERATKALHEARPLVGRAGDDALRAELEDLTALVLYWRAPAEGGIADAMTHVDRALNLRQQLDDRQGFAESLIHAAIIHGAHDNASPDGRRRSAPLLEEALELARAEGHATEEASAARHLGHLALEDGDLDRALDLTTLALTLTEASGHRLALVPALVALGNVWMARGDHKAARVLFDDALTAAERMGAVRFKVDARLALSRVEERRGEPGDARRHAEAARAVARAAGFAAGVEAASTRLADLEPAAR
jgi:tetratricopeptide (TPR) repeat protein